MRRPRRESGAAKRAAQAYGKDGALPLEALLLSKVWHRNPRRQRVYVGFENIGYAKLTLAEAKAIAQQVWQLADPDVQLRQESGRASGSSEGEKAPQ